MKSGGDFNVPYLPDGGEIRDGLRITQKVPEAESVTALVFQLRIS